MLIELTNNNINKKVTVRTSLLDRSQVCFFWNFSKQTNRSIYIGDLEVQSTIPFSLENKKFVGSIFMKTN